jgi:putative nucleotide binding protein
MSLYKDRRFEEYAYPLDFIPNARSTTIKKIEGPIVQALGQDYFTFLEILAKEGFTLVVGERIYIGKEGSRKDIESAR